MLFCRNCGTDLGPGAFCSSCGTPVDAGGEPAKRHPPLNSLGRNTGLHIKITRRQMIFMAVALAVVGYGIFSSSPTITSEMRSFVGELNSSATVSDKNGKVVVYYSASDDGSLVVHCGTDYAGLDWCLAMRYIYIDSSVTGSHSDPHGYDAVKKAGFSKIVFSPTDSSMTNEYKTLNF